MDAGTLYDEKRTLVEKVNILQDQNRKLDLLIIKIQALIAKTAKEGLLVNAAALSFEVSELILSSDHDDRPSTSSPKITTALTGLD